MEGKDPLTPIIAIYGAVLSTISIILSVVLGIREIYREKRLLKVIIEFVSWVEYFQLTIVNMGHRPVTITDISAVVFERVEKKLIIHEEIRSSDLFEEGAILPIKLKDGDHLSLKFSDFVQEYLVSGLVIKVRVYDIEGNVFENKIFREHDVKWGGYRKRKV